MCVSSLTKPKTLLDATSRKSLDVAAELELPKGEDAVMSLANLSSKDSLITLAGINSSEAEQKAGKNEHMRAFAVSHMRRGKQGQSSEEKEREAFEATGSIMTLGKSNLFTPATGPKPETYQRLLRLSPARRSEHGSRRIGAAATGLAKQSEIVIFDATRTPPSSAELITRISVPAEAVDLDIAETLQSQFSVTWCTDYDVFEQTIEYNFQTRKAEFTPRGPRRIHSVSNIDNTGRTITRSKYRSIRFLTGHHVLVLSNLPNKKGTELFIMHLYPTGPAAVLFHKILPSRMKQGIGLDVCALDADQHGSRQFVVAVGGQDISIEVFTINYNRPTDTFTPFKSFTTLRDVHPLQMTALTLSSFHPPTRPASSETTKSEPAVAIGPQLIRLASTSMGNTVVVDTFELSQLDSKKRDSRWVLSHPSTEKWTQGLYIALISFIVLMMAMVLQSFIYPDSAPTMISFLPPGARQSLAKPASAASGAGHQVSSAASDAISSAAHSVPSLAMPKRLKDLMFLHSPGSGKPHNRAVVLRSAGSDSTDVSVDVVPDRHEYIKQDAQARHWEELQEHEKIQWREALIKAGHWVADEGEAIFKGVLFSSYAGLVGQAAAQALN